VGLHCDSTVVFLTKKLYGQGSGAANIHYVTPPPGEKWMRAHFCSQVVAANPRRARVLPA